MSVNFLPVEDDDASLREWFYRLVNARENPATLSESRTWIIRLLADPMENPAIPGEPVNDTESDSLFANGTGGHFVVKPPPTPNPANAGLIGFHAPLALLEGSWLQSVALAGNNHNEPINSLFACYRSLLGRNEAESPAFAYRGWLNLCQIGLPEATAWRFAHDPRIGTSALYLASLQLALGLNSANFHPETLGFTLAYLNSASPWRLAALPQHQRSAILTAMDGHTKQAMSAFTNDSEAWLRINKGLALYQTGEAHYLKDLNNFAKLRIPLAGQVAEIFRRKLRFARGYHSGVKLAGRGLEDWLTESTFDATGFIDAFAASRYAKGGRGHRPFDQLTGFGGPMFGVFSPEELDCVNAWLDELEAGPNQLTRTATDGIAQSTRLVPSRQGAASIPHSVVQEQTIAENPNGLLRSLRHLPFLASRFVRINNRTLFYRLINQDLQVDTLADARHSVEQALSHARRARSRLGPINTRFFDYSAAAFIQRIAEIHETEVAKYRPFQAPPKLSKEEYIWGIRQFAPSILVDGCWLQHLGEAASQDLRPQRLLYRIYAEELGEGRIGWNHSKIYRDLLTDMEIELPPLKTEAFARHPGFLDSSFDLPTFLLAISQFPRTYFPEILGLNLAIELSGLGGGYMRLADELRHWNINPLIVTLHLSIDNLAAGHSAMACEAAQLYLDKTFSMAGLTMQQEVWQRIWSGYLSLNSVTRRFKMALLAGFCINFMPQRFRSFLQKN